MEELTEDGLRRVFHAHGGAVEGFDLTTSLRKLVRGLTGLRGDVINSIKNYWRQGATAAAALAAAEEALRLFAKHDWGNERPSSTRTISSTLTATSSNPSTTMSKPTTTSSSSVTTSSATATPHYFTTKEGTDPAKFKEYIETLDGGVGKVFDWPELSSQSYYTNLTTEQAKSVGEQPFVEFIFEDGPLVTSDAGAVLSPKARDKRVNLNPNLRERPRSSEHLRLLSVKDQASYGANALPDYLYDPSLGSGSTVYVIDTGFNLDHEELQPIGRSIRPVIVSNTLTLSQNKVLKPAPEEITDYDGHGTAVASVVGGLTLGVAPRADLVLIKYKGGVQTLGSGRWTAAEATKAAVAFTWNFVVNDVKYLRGLGKTGVFSVNLSAGYELDYTMNEVLTIVLEKCWKHDIVTVTAAGNDGTAAVSLDQFTPQTIGTPDNGLITVGGVDVNGMLAPHTRFDAGKGGSITVYADSVGVLVADNKDKSGSKVVDGTSFAAPAVAGLAAYFGSLPSLNHNWPPGSVSKRMKDFITRLAYARLQNPIPQGVPPGYMVPGADTIKVAYNGAGDGLCSTNPIKRRAQNGFQAERPWKRDDSDGVDVMVDGTLVLPAFSRSYCDATSASETESGLPTTHPAETTTAVETSGLVTSTAETRSRTTEINTVTFAACKTQTNHLDDEIATSYCVCSGSTFAQSTNTAVSPPNVCAYTVPLPSTTTAVSISATVQSSTTVNTMSSATPPPVCTSAVAVIGPSLFYLYQWTDKFTGATSWGAGIVPSDSWTCEGIAYTPADGTDTGPSAATEYPYSTDSIGATPPARFTLNPQLRCNENTMTFTARCGSDHSWIVTSANQGGTALCFSRDFTDPGPLSCGQGIGVAAQTYHYTALMLCYGGIC